MPGLKEDFSFNAGFYGFDDFNSNTGFEDYL